MGMYTELVCAFELKKETPKNVIEILEAMCEGEVDQVGNFPDHPLFKTSRWKWMLTSNSYYFPGDTRSTIRYDGISTAYIVTIRCNLKNYDSEIEKFIDWVKPYIDDYGFIGYSRYEECESPTLIFV